MTRTRTHTNGSEKVVVCHPAAYVRVSTDEQAESGLGLGDQRRRCEAMAEVKGWPAPVIYEDAGISGTKEAHQRPALQKLLQAVRAGEVDAVIILSLDRLGRVTRIVLGVVEELSTHGAALVSCKEQLDTSTAQGQFVLTMFAALAQLERDLISERTTGALAELSRSTGETGGGIPFGYVRADNRRVKKDAATAAVVVRIFALHRRGESTRRIAARLERDGVPAPRGSARWHHSSVAFILNNRAAYSGGLRGASRDVRWPAIVGRAAA